MITEDKIGKTFNNWKIFLKVFKNTVKIMYGGLLRKFKKTEAGQSILGKIFEFTQKKIDGHPDAVMQYSSRTFFEHKLKIFFEQKS